MTAAASQNGTHLDAKGLKCPLPVLKARKALKSVPAGGTLTVEATDPAAYLDFQHFCDSTGNEMVDWAKHDGVFTFVIRKNDG